MLTVTFILWHLIYLCLYKIIINENSHKVCVVRDILMFRNSHIGHTLRVFSDSKEAKETCFGDTYIFLSVLFIFS